MAILRAAATANFTLDNTGTAVLITGLTLTPAADDYFLYCTIEFLTPSTAPAEDDTFSVWVGGSQIGHSLRYYDGDTSVDNASITYALTCKVSPTGSQAVEIRHTRTSATGPCVASKREMTLFPMPAAGTDYEDSATGTDTVASATYDVVTSMTRTPVSGDYLAVFSATVEAPSGAAAGFRMRVGGTVQTHTLREIFYESSAFNVRLSVMLIAHITANGSQAVDIQFNRPTGSGTVTVHARTLNLIPVASGDIKTATGTADDIDSTTTDKLLDDMTITDPGAADYLTMFSMTQAWGTLSADQGRITLSVHENGSIVTDTDRDNEVEDSLDNAYMSAYTGGRVTVGSGTSDLEVFWQGASTVTRTGRERTFIAMREVAIGDIDAVLPIVTAATADLKAKGKLDATTALVFAQTADLKATGKLDAALPAVFDSTADLKADGKLDSVLPMVFSQTSDLKARGKMDAVLSMILGTAAALSSTNEIDAALPIVTNTAANLIADGKLDATLPIVISIAADLKGRGSVASNLPIAFSVTSDLNAVGKLDGTLSIVFGHTADLKASGKLDVALPTVFAQTANLTADGKLDIALPIVFGVTANLSDATGGAISAVLPVITTIAPNLNGIGKLDTTLPSVFIQAAGLSATGKLDAILPIVFTPIASLAADGKLDATLSIVAGVAANLVSRGKLDAAVAIVSAIVADLKGRGVLVAAPNLVFSVAADLKAKGQLAGTLPIVFTQAASITNIAPAIFYHIDLTAAKGKITITPFAGRIN